MTPQPASGLQVHLIADDLTGACDAAVAFAARGLRTEVSTAASGVPGDGVAVSAQSTDTRDGSIAHMQSRLRTVLEEAPPCQHLFKKVDSVLRGNSLDEIALTLGWWRQRVIVAPSHPRLGRFARHGTVHVLDLDKEHHLHVTSELTQRGHCLPVCPRGLSLEDTRSMLGEAPRVFCDAETQDDLLHLVEAVQSFREPVLWVGSGGLAEALAQHLHGPAQSMLPRPTPQGGTMLFFVGSTHPVTMQQVRALQASTAAESSARLRIIPVRRGVTTNAEIQQQLADIVPDQVSCLFMTGGDTATQVCAALGITALRLVQEFAPGLPEALAVGGRFAGVPVLVKSGGFGHREVLCHIAHASAPRLAAQLKEARTC